MGFLHPELLLIAIPALAVWWFARGADRMTRAVRLVTAIIIILAAAGIYLKASAPGRDLMIVVDRSRSMPAGSQTKVSEIIRLAEGERRDGDRIGIVSFGARPQIEKLALADDKFTHFEKEIDADGSDLGDAVETALQMIPEGRNGAILVISDGEYNGKDPVPIARRAFSRDVKIHTRALARPADPDLAVERVDLPDAAATGEPFQFVVWVRSDVKREAEYQLERDGKSLTSGKRVFEEGLNRLVFRDSVDRAGVSKYIVKLSENADPVPENNRAVAVLRVEGARPLLIINNDGDEDALATALRNAQFPIVVSAPEKLSLDLVSLTAYRAVILENVSANRLRPNLDGLRDFVTERGGGLFITGGRASFGVGGYYKSTIDDCIPVTMEMRQEHRKFGIGLAISLDRSGSMAMPVGNGLQKMDLANLGTCAAIELLSPMDSVAVIAVDSAPHIIVEMGPANKISEITNTVRTIKSMGGGIFCYTALVAAGKELERARQDNKHIILFADAADSEEPGKYKELLEEFRKANITVSVIGLGSEHDSDAEFLKDIAKRGGGEIYFTTDPDELPRLFSQDTMTVSRSTFIEQLTNTAATKDLLTIGEMIENGFPAVEGYNLTYLRPGASLGVMSVDEYKAPIVAFMYHGLGRSAALTAQIGGTKGKNLVSWKGFSSFASTTARWLVGQEEPREFFTSVRRDGKDAIVSVEIDADAKQNALPADTAQLSARITEPNGKIRELTLDRVNQTRFEARYPLTREGVSLGTVKLNDKQFVSLPPVALPYSPEFERAGEADRGTKLLKQIAAESGGRFEPDMPAVFDGERGGRAWRVLTRELLWAALGLLVLEIAGRRLGFWGMIIIPARVRKLTDKFAVANIKKKAPAPSRAPVEKPAAAAPAPPVETPKATKTPEPPKEPTIGDALARARKSAERKLGK